MLDEENGFYYRNDNGKRINLTPTETELLSFFIERKQHIIPHQVITTHLYGDYSESSITSLRQVVCRINKKLRGEVMILARTSVGYRMIYMGV